MFIRLSCRRIPATVDSNEPAHPPAQAGREDALTRRKDEFPAMLSHKLRKRVANTSTLRRRLPRPWALARDMIAQTRTRNAPGADATEKLSREQIDQGVLEIREAWKREGLDIERLYKVAVLAHQYRADQYECLPGCCGRWGEIEPLMPPGPRAALTVNQLYQDGTKAVLFPSSYPPVP